MIQILLEEMCTTSLQRWKGTAIYEFQSSKCQKFRDANAKNLKMQMKKTTKIIGISIHGDFNHQLAHRDIREALWKFIKTFQTIGQE